MNQYIEIHFKPEWTSDPDYWEISFQLIYEHREKAPSYLDSDGDCHWWFHDHWNKNESIY